jgi:predicted naringenin-chalcone synthase
MSAFLSDFRSRRPAYESTQEATFEWLASAHARAEAPPGASADELGSSTRSMEKLIRRFGCSPSQIGRRGHEVADCLHPRWHEMRVYDLERDPGGAGAGVRTELFAGVVERFFDDVYADEAVPPQEMIHVTCTGYVSPSAAQRLVSRKGWGERTGVTHAYHMGCYAALPAVRLARGQLALGFVADARIDVVHTEVCSLHFDPTVHSPEQIVVQTLFADGYMRYAVRSRRADGAALCVLAQREEIVPNSAGAMSWTCSDRAMRMSLARDIPERIARYLPGFLDRLHRDAGLSFARERSTCFFAVHPGGPRILDAIAARLEVSESQIAASRRVLFEHGNMSSATLPHVWRDLLEDKAVPLGSLISTVAFGPGLTCAGAVLRKG